ncbi:hypothetical protein FFLO_04255 [Filobasidium floriforme]|uniref:Vps53 N-terminal domain-containing protein n=1 Tax=Filobasidium floriforme TaxID=5210 RepID=A0A8K0JJ72_9TREE|nr:hypothetical protein FFLO_04255 [Filobasidium floriforme]
MSIITPNVDKWKQVHAILAEQAGGGTETIDYQANDAMSELQRMLPDQVSLDNLHQLRRSQHSKIMALKSRITSLRAELVEKQDPGRMQETQRLISDLIGQVNDIREKAAEAEAIVTTITKDIQRLDLAKRNMTTAITALRRWGMLQQAHKELKELLVKRDYAPMANSIAAIDGLSTSLQALTTNPPVASVFKEISDVRTRVKDAVSHELDAFLLQDPNKPTDRDKVGEAYLVADALGSDFKAHAIERYVNTELREYRRIFAPSSEAGHLDNTARRFAWFRRVLKTHDEEHAPLFPPRWEVDRILVAKFADSTRTDLRTSIEGDRTPSVATLLEAWQVTLEWEAQMSQRFHKPFDKVVSDLPFGQASATVSSIFGESMKVFVDAQDKALSDMLSAYRGNRSRPSLEGASVESETPVSVLPSSTELFYFYAQILEQCRRYSTGRGMKDLAGVLAKWLRIYSDDVLIASMKKVETRPSMDGRPNLQEVKNACLALNTADYCLVTSTQLEEKLKDTIDLQFRDDVSFQAERDLFLGVISACLITILGELESACEPALSTVLRTSWSNVENVSGRSPYVSDLVGSIKSVAEVVRERVNQKRFVKSFADKAVGMIMTRYTAAVVRSRPLRKVGAEQVLLDVQAIKACLLEIPEPYTSSTANTYTRLVQKQTSQLETMLKVVLVPEDPPDGFVQNYCLLIGDKSFSNFQKVLDLKGTLRSNQQQLLDIFLSVTSSNPDLQDTSFLTTLDMDPENKSAAVASMVTRTDSRSNLSSQIGGPLRSETPKGFGDFKKLVSFAIHGQLTL